MSGLLGFLGAIAALAAVIVVGWNALQGVLAIKTELNTILQNAGGLIAPLVTTPFGIEPTPQLLQWLAAVLPLAASLVFWLTRSVVRAVWG